MGNPGVTSNTGSDGPSGKGYSSVPRPKPKALPPCKKKGTSLPSEAPIRDSNSIGTRMPISAGNPSNTAAASVDPPPSPPPIGMRLVNLKLTRAPLPVSSKRALAARTIRLSAMFSSDSSVTSRERDAAYWTSIQSASPMLWNSVRNS